MSYREVAILFRGVSDGMLRLGMILGGYFRAYLEHPESVFGGIDGIGQLNLAIRIFRDYAIIHWGVTLFYLQIAGAWPRSILI